MTAPEHDADDANRDGAEADSAEAERTEPEPDAEKAETEPDAEKAETEPDAEKAETEPDAEKAGAEATEVPPPDRHAAVLASWGYPSFARGFPRHPELDALVDAFAQGDYLTVRTRAPALAASPDVPAAVQRAAELLRARVEPDKTARTFFALTAALLVFLTVWWVTHDGPEHHAPAPAVVPPTVEFVK